MTAVREPWVRSDVPLIVPWALVVVPAVRLMDRISYPVEWQRAVALWMLGVAVVARLAPRWVALAGVGAGVVLYDRLGVLVGPRLAPTLAAAIVLWCLVTGLVGGPRFVPPARRLRLAVVPLAAAAFFMWTRKGLDHGAVAVAAGWGVALLAALVPPPFELVARLTDPIVRPVASLFRSAGRLGNVAWRRVARRSPSDHASAPAAALVDATTWDQVRPAVAHRVAVTVPCVVSAVPLAVRLDDAGVATWRVLAVAAVAVATILAARSAPKVAAAAAVAAGFAGVWALADVDRLLVAGVATATAVLWSVSLGVLPAGRRRATPSLTLPATVPLGAAAFLLVFLHGWWWPLLLCGASLVLLVSTRLVPGPARRLATWFEGFVRPWTDRASAGDAVVQRVARAAGVAIGVVAMLPAFAVFVASALAQRIVRFDPLDPPSERGTRWVERPALDPDPRRLFTSNRTLDPRGAGRWLHRMAAGAMAAILIAVAVVSTEESGLGGVVARAADALGAPFDQPEAVALTDAVRDEPWWPKWNAEWEWINQPGADRAWRPIGPYRVRDVRSEFINVTDGVRKSWAPGPCTCRRVKVWMYGGSAAFGFGQRDDHTIESEISRLASAAGLTVDVENRGVMGDVLWQESVRFGWDLEATDVLPDLVLFYDGYNDMRAAFQRAIRNEPLNDTPMDLTAEQLLEEYQRSVAEPRDVPGADVELAPTTSAPTLSAAQLAPLMIKRYERARRTTNRLAGTYDVPLTYVWQPNAFASEIDPSTMPNWAPGFVEAARLVPRDVLNLAQVFRGRRAIFIDEIHTNERGARLVAEAIFRSIEPRLVAASKQPHPARER